MKRSFFRACFAACILQAACFSATAQTGYPRQNISFVVAYPAGGPSDVAARSLLPPMQRDLGQPIIVNNISGAGGTLAVRKVLSGKPDGYEMLVGTPSEVVLAPLALTSAKYKSEELRMVAQLSYTHMVLVARPTLGANTFQEVLSYMRDPASRELTYGSFGIGSLSHFMFEDMKLQTNGRLTHVAYKGMAPVIQDLLGGVVDVGFLPLIGSTLDLINSGKLRPLMVTDNVRSPKLPNVPAAGEFKEIKSFDYIIWGGLFVPRATPEAIVNRLSAAIHTALRDPEYRKFTEGGGAVVSPEQTTAQAERLFRSEVERYQRIAKAIKLDPQ